MTGTEDVDGFIAEEQSPADEVVKKKYKRKLRYLSKFYFTYFCFVVFCALLGITLKFYSLHNNINLNAETFNYRIFGGLFAALATGVVIIAISYAIIPTKPYGVNKLSSAYLDKPKNHNKVILNILYYLGLAVATIILVNNIDNYRLCVQRINNGTSSFVGYIIIWTVTAIVEIAAVFIQNKNKKLANSLLTCGDSLNLIIAEEISAGKIKPFGLRDLIKYSNHNIKKRIFIIVAEAAYVTLIVLIFCLAAFVPPNPYKISAIEKVDIGDNSGYVYRMFGEPYDRSEYSGRDERGQEITYATWTWCSSGLAKQIATKTEQLNKLTESENFSDVDFERIIKLSEQILNLELELSMTCCDYVTINFVDGLVTSVEFKNNYLELEPKDASVTRIVYALVRKENIGNVPDNCYDYAENHVFKNGSTIENCRVRMYLSDGSMVNKIVTFASAVTKDNPSVKWSDEYGEHIFTAKFE